MCYCRRFYFTVSELGLTKICPKCHPNLTWQSLDILLEPNKDLYQYLSETLDAIWSCILQTYIIASVHSFIHIGVDISSTSLLRNSEYLASKLNTILSDLWPRPLYVNQKWISLKLPPITGVHFLIPRHCRYPIAKHGDRYICTVHGSPAKLDPKIAIWISKILHNSVVRL